MPRAYSGFTQLEAPDQDRADEHRAGVDLSRSKIFLVQTK